MVLTSATDPALFPSLSHRFSSTPHPSLPFPCPCAAPACPAPYTGTCLPIGRPSWFADMLYSPFATAAQAEPLLSLQRSAIGLCHYADYTETPSIVTFP